MKLWFPALHCLTFFLIPGISGFSATALELTAEPWISHPDHGRVTVNFISDQPSGGALDYRKRREDDWQRRYDLFAGQIVTDRREHRITLAGSPGEIYEFRTVLIDPADRNHEVPAANPGTVTLPGPATRDYSFFVVSDLQFPAERERELLQKLGSLADFPSCAFGVTLGDMSMSFDTVEEDIFAKWLTPLSRACPSTPLVMVRGNHEWRGRAASEWVRLLGEPERRTPYFAFRFGQDFFIVLDSGEDKPDNWPGHSYTAFHCSADYRHEQRRWLQSVVETPEFRAARYRIVLIHCAAYGNGNGFNIIDVRNLTAGLLDRTAPEEKIHLMLGGHDHFYLRGMAGDDRLFAVPTAGEKKTQSRTSGKRFPYPVVLQDGPGSSSGGGEASTSRLNLSDRGIELKSYLDDGTLIDHVVWRPDGTAEVKIAPPVFEVTDYPVKSPRIDYRPYSGSVQ